MGDQTRRDVAMAGASGAAAAIVAALGAQEIAQAAEAAPNLYLFLYRPGPAWREGVPMREQGLGPHAAYMQRLLDEGRLFAAGGFVNADGGMAIVMAANLEAAEAMLADDPAIVSGIFTSDLRHWGTRFRVSAPLP